MSRVLGIVLCCVFATSAAASSYSEFNAGIAAAKRKDYAGATAHMSIALAADDLNPAFRAPAYVVRGEASVIANQPANAIGDLSKAIEADPNYFDAYALRALCYVATKQFDLAAADAAMLIRAKPYSVGSYAERAAVYLAQKNFDAALGDLNTIVALAPRAASSYLARGEAYRDHGDYAKALEDIEKADDLSSSANVDYQRALTYEAMSDYARARSDYEKAAKLEPANPAVKVHLALLSWKSGDFAAAAKGFQAVRDAANKDLSSYAALWAALSLAATGQTDLSQSITANLDRTKWPGPLLDLYSGTSTVAAVMAAAQGGEADSRADHICEAAFYIGMWQVLHGDAAAGKVQLQNAAAQCSPQNIERDAAAVAYRRLP